MNTWNHFLRRLYGFQSTVLLMLATGTALAVTPVLTAPDPEPSAGSMAQGTGAPVSIAIESATSDPEMIPPSSPTPDAPAVVSTIEGINFDEGASNAGFYNIPPDPMGAAGPNHVVSVVNTSIEWHTKAGVQQLSQKLGFSNSTNGFFGPVSPVNLTFDPKVVYDPHAGRFVVVTLERNDSGVASSASNTSRILIAVSDDSDPNGTWYYMAINSKISISGVERWADYPGLAVDEEAIYITNNMFGFTSSGTYGGTRLWIINKTPLYTGGAGTFTVHDPYAGGGTATTTQPTQIIGTPPAGSTGTFLVSYSGLTDGPNESLQIVRVDNPLTAPSFAQQYVSIGNIDNTAGAYNNAPQSGTATLVNTNDRRAQNAVWRNNRLYTTATVVPPSGTNSGQVTARFWELNTTTLASISQVQSGEIGGEDIAAGAYTFFPSIAVNSSGAICVGFSASASTIFPGAYAAVQLPGDAAGTVRPAMTVAAGQAYYIRTFGSGRNRWGDYSGTSVDPSNDSDFWIFNEYAMTRGTAFSGEDGRWATKWAKIDVATQSPTLTSPADNATVSNPVAVSFSLPEAALSGSLNLILTGSASRTLTLASSQESAGAHSFTFDPANPTATAQIASITGGTSIPNGTYTVTLSYQDTLSNAAATDVSTGVVFSTPLVSWRALHGLASNGSNDLGNPSGDGVKNLMKFALNLAPNAGDLLLSKAAPLSNPNGTSVGALTGLPVCTRNGSGQAVFTFIRRKSSTAPGITYTVQFTNTLGGWAANPSATESVLSLDSIWERVTVTDNVSPTKRFARLQVAVGP